MVKFWIEYKANIKELMEWVLYSGFEMFEEDVPECIHLRIHVLWNH